MTYRETGIKCDESAVFADPMGVPWSSVSWIPAFAGMTCFRTARLCVPSFLRRQESIAYRPKSHAIQSYHANTTALLALSFLRPGSSTKRLRFVGVVRQESITLCTEPGNSQPIHPTTTALHTLSFLRRQESITLTTQPKHKQP
jgi:hypothetical protein